MRANPGDTYHESWHAFVCLAIFAAVWTAGVIVALVLS